jgi:hypothetical protein
LFEVNGTSFEEGTDPEAARIVEDARGGGKRLELHYANGEESGNPPLSCYVGRSCGPMKVPLILARRASTGGPQLDCIDLIKIYEWEGRRKRLAWAASAKRVRMHRA